MKTVCIIVYRMGVGGAEQTVVGEIQEFLRRGFRVQLVTLCPEREGTLIGFVPPECEKVTIEFRSLYDFSAYRALISLLDIRQPDIIITQMWFANTVGRIAARISGMQGRLLSFEQNVYDRLKLKTWKQFLVDRFLQRWCVKVVAASRAIGESLVRSGIKKERVVIIYDSIDLSRITNAPVSPIREELGIQNEFIYFFAGRLVHQKGVDILLKAFSQQGSGVLLIAGQGIERPSLEQLSSELGIKSRVFFLGVRQDVPAIMKAADCFVLASRLEGLGMVLVEAIAAGLPVVATAVDGIPEVIASKELGVLVPPEDVAALAEGMREARQEVPAKTAAKAKENEGKMRRLFSIEKHVDDILTLMATAH